MLQCTKSIPSCTMYSTAVSWVGDCFRTNWRFWVYFCNRKMIKPTVDDLDEDLHPTTALCFTTINITVLQVQVYPYSTALCFTTINCTVLHVQVLNCASLQSTILYCKYTSTLLYCTTINCTVHFTANIPLQ